MPDTSNTIANEALQAMGGNQYPAITGEAPTFDTSTAGKAAALLYQPCVNFVLRKFPWDCARRTAALVVTGNTAPSPWAYEYIYPDNAVQLWQLMPETISDPNNPLPQNWNVANNVVAGVQKRVIQTDLQNAKAVYNVNPLPQTWDAGLRQAVVRLLASEFAIALAGRPETSQVLIESAGGVSQIAERRTD